MQRIYGELKTFVINALLFSWSLQTTCAARKNSFYTDRVCYWKSEERRTNQIYNSTKHPSLPQNSKLFAGFMLSKSPNESTFQKL